MSKHTPNSPDSLREANKNLYTCYGYTLVAFYEGARSYLHTFFSIIGIASIFISLFFIHKPDSLGLGNYATQLIFVFSSVGVLFLGGPLFYFTASTIIKRKRLPISEMLMSLAVLLDYGISVGRHFSWIQTGFFGDTIPFLLTGYSLPLFFIISYLEGYYRKKAYQDLSEIYSRRILKARKIDNKGLKEVIDVTHLKVGDQVEILAGEMIPCDGKIILGTTSVDESKFTAEPTILLKGPGDLVTGSTLNRDGTIVIELIKPYPKHFLEEMIQLIQQAILNQVGVQKWLEQRPFFIFLTTLVLMGATYFYHQTRNLEGCWMAMMSVLFVACFFTFGRNLPSITALGIGRAARYGILFQTEKILNRLAKLNTLFFEKTGTLTRGEFYFSNLFLETNVNQGDFLSLLFSLEAKATHPLAKGVKTHPWHREIQRHEIADFETHEGLGISGKVLVPGIGKKREIFACVGNQRLLKRKQMYISKNLRDKIESLEAMGETVVLCGWDRSAKGLVGFSDTLRPDVKKVLVHLKSLHITPVMLTGDHDEMISNLAFTKELKHTYTRCLPEEKASKISKSQMRGNFVGLVKHSREKNTNLDKANVGMILAAGTRMPVNSTGVTITGSRLSTIADAIRYSRMVVKTIQNSIALTLIYGTSGFALAFLGLFKPTLALMTMAASSLVLTVYPLRLKSVKFISDYNN